MNQDINELKVKAEVACDLYKTGNITRKEAEKEIKPYIEMVNNKMKEIAKKYNQKPKLISMSTFLR